MKKTILITAAVSLLLTTACSGQAPFNNTDGNSVSSSQQTADSESSSVNMQIQSSSDDAPRKSYTPINYETQIGMWFPYLYYDEYMKGKSADEFRAAVRELYSEAKRESVNTVYLHVRPNGDAYYKSEIFPKGISLDGDYDPFQIMLEEAHKLGLSVHAWINPLRLQTTSVMETVPDNFITKQWASDPNSRIVREVNGRFYLNPAREETAEILRQSVDEIVSQYDVDGIHIDDYFYPTTDPQFDSVEFEASGSSDLSEWRTDNISRLVRTIYDTVKSKDDRILFGISPQGSISNNYNTQYADVKLWAGSDDYCDYIVPQIYYGFRNSTNPFAETLAQWESLTGENVNLIIGLAAYKQGKYDKWAGVSGEQEWIEESDVIQRQIELVEKSSADGYALYK